MKKDFTETLKEVMVDLPDFYAKKGGVWLRKQHAEVDGKMVHTLDVTNGREWYEISNVSDISKI